MKYIKNLDELSRGDLALAGGKGANLGELIRAGMPVPAGFCVTTPAYLHFVEGGRLQAQIERLTASLQPDDPRRLEEVSAQIRALFEQGSMPQETAAEVCAAYAQLAGQEGLALPAVAVRSSATAEDLPNLSFAGQQDTYLNVVGGEQVLRAVLRCWGSLWTARAIGYRLHNAIGGEGLALAVVVQRMVESETSGVLFTANPLTGRRGETVIDAAFGLGEALVSGAVEPDHYVVDAAQGRILHKTRGAKAISIRGLTGGGTQTRREEDSTRQALADEHILELARLGQRSQAHFGAPQDMEWAWADGRLFVLQSRAVTSLFPLPERAAAHPLQAFFSFASWQGMLDPYSPLGQDVFTGLVAGIGRAFGTRTTQQEQNILVESGGRLFVNITPLLRSPQGRGFIEIFIDAIDPVSLSVVQELFKKPEFAPAAGKMGLRTRLGVSRVVLMVLGSVVSKLVWPARGRRKLEETIQHFVSQAAGKAQAARNLGEFAALMEETALMGPGFLLPHLLPGVISGQVPFQLLFRLAQGDPACRDLPYELTRGLAHNVTTEMDMLLWSTACAIRSDPASRRLFLEGEAHTLAGELPPAAQQAAARFLERYGARGLAEVDIYRPRWNENPVHVMQMLKNYLQIDVQNGSPETAFRKGKERAVEARRELMAAFRRRRQPLKAFLAGILAQRFFELGGLRETPKFAIVRLLDVMRKGLLRIGQQMAEQGVLEQGDDLFFLHLWELRQFAEGSLLQAGSLIRQRRQDYARELGRKRIPRILLSDGTAYFEGICPAGEADGRTLNGAPVSPGTAEGVAHVILDPHGEHLAPGEILVCPATDPAWTPLFLTAGALVMEVGGMMTHGSVVAREYGIPAVVGVADATTRLKSGQRLRVDGSAGVVTLLDGDAA